MAELVTEFFGLNVGFRGEQPSEKVGGVFVLDVGVVRLQLVEDQLGQDWFQLLGKMKIACIVDNHDFEELITGKSCR